MRRKHSPLAYFGLIAVLASTAAGCGARDRFPTVQASTSLQFARRDQDVRYVHLTAPEVTIEIDRAIHTPVSGEELSALVADRTRDLVAVSLDARGYRPGPLADADARLTISVHATVGDNPESTPLRCLVDLPDNWRKCQESTAGRERAQTTSTLMMDLSLIDAKTGVSLWHARQRFPAHAIDREHIRRSVSRVMAALPFRQFEQEPTRYTAR